ncbi:MAG: 2-amino-4-hydroxy-6-hydroxymethyldihydropteridine diphosphokinase [Nitrospinota bacterium]
MGNTAFLGVGSNIGDGVGNCKEGLQKIGSMDDIIVEKVSSFYRTSPVGEEQQSWFTNCVASLTTGLGPAAVLSLFLATEKKMGRKRTKKWGERVIDLDLLLYEDEVIQSEFLTLPHPRMHERAFVLVPLLELIPEKRYHPVLGRPFSSLLNGISGQEVVRVNEYE